MRPDRVRSCDGVLIRRGRRHIELCMLVVILRDKLALDISMTFEHSTG